MARILVIDDSLSAIENARRILEDAGHTVESVELMIYLPQAVKHNPPDAILLDLSMPALSGVNVATFIRRYQERPIPIILYSSQPVDELRRIAKELGAAQYVKKGEPDDQLARAVEAVITTASSAHSRA
jgi:CheY-like chemotaxis protein